MMGVDGRKTYAGARTDESSEVGLGMGWAR